MKLYIKQKVFSLRDRFSVYDCEGFEVFRAFSEVLSFGHKLHITDLADREVAYVQQKVISFLPRYFISRNGIQVGEVVKEFTFFRHLYTVKGLNWSIEGDFLAHDYCATQNGRVVFTVSKQWFAWGDTYEINAADGVDAVAALAVVLVIDNCMQQQNNSKF